MQILVVMGLLMRIIHVVPALAGLSVTIVLVPITTVVSRRLSKVRRALIKCTDDRVKLVTEVITGNAQRSVCPHYGVHTLWVYVIVYIHCGDTFHGEAEGQTAHL